MNTNNKMREALRSIIENGIGRYLAKEINDVMLCRRIENIVKDALSNPPRNCDMMSLDDARKVWFLKEAK